MDDKDLEKMFNIRLTKRCCENCYFNQEGICKFNNELIKESKECDYFIDKKMVLEQMINNAMEIKKIKNMIENPDFQKKMDVFIEKNQELKEHQSLEEHAKKLEENFKELFDGVNVFGKGKNTDIIDNYMAFKNVNANPSEALRCFYKIYNTINLNWNKDLLRVGIDVCNRSDCYDGKEMANCLDTIKQALFKSQKQEKVLEIIKKKRVNIDLLYASSSVEQYNDELVRVYGMCFVKDRQLVEEEFDLLKRYCNGNNL